VATSSSDLTDCAHWFLERDKTSPQRAYSIAVDINCPACQPSVARAIGRYLDEFGDFPSLSWKAFDQQLLSRLQTSPPACKLLGGGENLPLALAKIGGSIIEGSGVAEKTATHPHTFLVCLACKRPESAPFHLHLNQKRFEPSKIVSVIADSFLEWANSGGDPATFARDEQLASIHAKSNSR
jgi:hypothetical protein